MNKTDFRRLIDDRKEPEWVRREVDYALKSREMKVDRSMRNRGLTLERKLPEVFKALYKRYAEQKGQKTNDRDITGKLNKKNTTRLAHKVGLAYSMRFHEKRQKRLAEHAASLQGKSLNEWLVDVVVAQAEKDVHGERVYKAQ